MDNTRWSKWIERIKDISIIVTCVGALVAMVLTVTNIRSSWKQDKLTRISEANKLFEREFEIKKDIHSFMRLLPQKKVSIDLIKKYGNGAGIYYSDEFLLYRKITHHYEQIGALVKAGYIDFDLYYDVIPFPDEFFEKTNELRSMVGNNWNGYGNGLSDFMSNCDALKKMYIEKRKRISQ